MSHSVREFVLAIGLMSLFLASSCSLPSELPEQKFTCAPQLDNPSESKSNPHTIHYQILIDLRDSSPKGQERILKAIEPYMLCAITDGSYIQVTIDPGAGQELVTPKGLGGAKATEVQAKRADTRERRTRSAVEEYNTAIKNAIATTNLGQYGSATRLIAMASSNSKDSGNDAMDIYILWSDLLGTSADGEDCLDVSGVSPTKEDAQAMVKRCIGEGKFGQVSNGGFKLVGVGDAATNAAQQRFAGQLGQQIAREVFELP